MAKVVFDTPWMKSIANSACCFQFSPSVVSPFCPRFSLFCFDVLSTEFVPSWFIHCLIEGKQESHKVCLSF